MAPQLNVKGSDSATARILGSGASGASVRTTSLRRLPTCRLTSVIDRYR